MDEQGRRDIAACNARQEQLREIEARWAKIEARRERMDTLSPDERFDLLLEDAGLAAEFRRLAREGAQRDADGEALKAGLESYEVDPEQFSGWITDASPAVADAPTPTSDDDDSWGS
jgi:hypothetical protein